MTLIGIRPGVWPSSLEEAKRLIDDARTTIKNARSEVVSINKTNLETMCDLVEVLVKSIESK